MRFKHWSTSVAILFFVLIACELFGLESLKLENSTLSLATSLIFLNGTHVFFTYYQIAMRQDFRNQFAQINPSLRLPMILITLLFLSLFLINHCVFKFAPPNFKKLFVWFVLIWGAWHNLQQTKGIALLADQNQFRKKEKRKNLNRLSFFIFLFASYYLATALYEIPKQWKALPIILAAISLFFWLKISMRDLNSNLPLSLNGQTPSSNRNESELWEFTLIWFLWMLIPFSTLAVFAVRSVHGVEYLQFQKRIFSRRFLIFIVFVTSLLYAGLYLYLKLYQRDLLSDFVTPTERFITSILLTLTLFHYLSDGIIFRNYKALPHFLHKFREKTEAIS